VTRSFERHGVQLVLVNSNNSALPHLELAVEDVLAGRQVAVAETEPYGCSIIW
jgi:hypothetical protein